MRHADLRVYDIRLITGLLGTFCALSLLFFLFLYGNYILPKMIPIKTYLWSSYGVIALVGGGIYLLSKKTQFAWVRLVGASDMLGKGKYPLEKGKSYLVQEETKAADIVAETLTVKVPCLYITRTNPDILRQKNKQLTDANVLWLTELEATNTLNPTEVEEMSYTIQQYLDKSGASLVFFDGLPYMFNTLSFNRVLYFLQDLRDKISLKESVLLLSFDLSMVDQTKGRILQRELKVL